MTSAMMPKQKMPARSRILIMAAGTGLLAALMAFIWLHKIGQMTAGHAVPTLAVVVAARDIPARTLLSNELLQVRNLASGNAPAEAVTAPTDLIGKVTTVPIIAGSPLTQHMVAVRDINMGMAYVLPPSTRAITIPLDPVAGVAGFIKPGDHVDVLTAFVAANGATIARTVLQNLTVLATGTHVLPGYTPASREGSGSSPPENGAAVSKPEETPNATLMVTPNEAQTIMLAAARGKLQLVLRPADDPTRPVMVPVVSHLLATAGDVTAQASSPSVLHAAASVSRAENSPAPQAAAPVRNVIPLARKASLLHANSFTAHDSGANTLDANPSAPTALASPQSQPEARQATLTGVLSGNNACAILSIGGKDLLREIGDVVAGCKLIRIYERGIIVQAPGHATEPWLIGDSRRIPEAQP